MRQEQMLEMKLMLGDQIKDRFGVPAGIKESCFTRDFIPNEIAIDCDFILTGRDGAKFAPGGNIDSRGQPAASDIFEFGGIQTNQCGERLELRFFRGSS